MFFELIILTDNPLFTKMKGITYITKDSSSNSMISCAVIARKQFLLAIKCSSCQCYLNKCRHGRFMPGATNRFIKTKEILLALPVLIVFIQPAPHGKSFVLLQAEMLLVFLASYSCVPSHMQFGLWYKFISLGCESSVGIFVN